MEPQSEDLEPVRKAYGEGLYLQAHALSERLGPYQSWTSTESRVLAGRVLTCIGAQRLGDAAHLRAYRADPDNPEARYFYAYALLSRQGPLRAWRFVADFDEDVGSPDLQSDWLALKGSLLSSFRDFDTAEEYFTRAEAIHGVTPWLLVERASSLSEQDRRAEALETCTEALELRPWYRPALQVKAGLLLDLGRDEDAISLLQEASTRLEFSRFDAQLVTLHVEREELDEAERRLEAYVARTPLFSKRGQQWVASQRCGIARLRGDLEAACNHAGEAGPGFFAKVRESLVLAAEKSSEEQAKMRRLVPVAFVRQDHMTCAPATLVALAEFWGRTTDHLEVAAEICYDGTPALAERRWAEENGFVVREFSVTPESAAALVDRGLPFTLTTVEPGSAHLQAVVGVDEATGTLLIRDPSHRVHAEARADAFLKAQSANGPRGMVLVPTDQAELLEEVALPDAEPFDHYHALQHHLESHARDSAVAELEQLRQAYPDHWLTVRAGLSLASYDGDTAERLVLHRKRCELHPNDPALKLAMLPDMDQLVSQEERLEVLRDLCKKRSAHPIFQMQLAQALARDGRHQAEAMELLDLAQRRMSTDGGGFYIRGNLLRSQARFEEAREAFRFAVCLEDKTEHFAEAYFSACKIAGRSTEALDFLRGRFDRFCTKSADPALTLCWALEQANKLDEVAAVLDRAIAARPDDGVLLLAASDWFLRLKAPERSDQCLEQARGIAAPGALLRALAERSRSAGDTDAALAAYREVLEREPTALDVHAHVASLLAGQRGREAAVAHLEEVCSRFPHSHGLQAQWVEWLGAESPDLRREILERLLKSHPMNAWAQRELSLVLQELGENKEALRAAELATEIAPFSSASHGIRGSALRALHRMEDAIEAMREALRTSVDDTWALEQLIALSDGPSRRRKELRFVLGELREQHHDGPGLSAYWWQALGIVDSEELLESLRELRERRPELPHAWSVLSSQLLEVGQLEEAEAVALEATERFPFTPGAWMDLASARQRTGDNQGELASLMEAVRIAPDNVTAVQRLADCHDKAGEFDEALAVLESACGRRQFTPSLWGYRADICWRLDRDDEAIELLEQALRKSPQYSWAWSRLQDWADYLGKPERVESLARDLSERFPGQVESWLVLESSIMGEGRLSERLEAIERALEVAPRDVDVHDRKARRLAEAARFPEALKACAPPIFEGEPPLRLRGRAAWVEAERGDRWTAMKLMKEIVKEDPDYAWGWYLLGEWHTEEGDADEALEAAKEQARLAPQEVGAFERLGDAALTCKQVELAMSAFERALTMDPRRSRAALNLFHHHLSENAFDEAKRVLDIARPHLQPHQTLGLEIEWFYARGSKDLALKEFERLFVMPEVGEWSLCRARDGAERARVLSAMAETLFKLVRPGDVNASAVSFAVSELAVLDITRSVMKIPDKVSGDDDLWQSAAWTLLGHACENGNLDNKIFGFVREHRERLRADTQLWGQVGRLYLYKGEHAKAIAWLDDWEEREDIEPWMMVNLVASLRYLRRDKTAGAVSLTLLRNRPEAPGLGEHRLWLALDAYFAGREEEAQSWADRIDRSEFSGYYSYLYDLLELLLMSAPASTSTRSRKSAFVVSKEFLRLADESYPHWADHAVLKRYRGLCISVLARKRGGLWAWVWSAYKR